MSRLPWTAVLIGFVAPAAGVAGTINGSLSVTMSGAPEQRVYNLSINDGARSLTFRAQYNMDVAANSYSPFVFSGFDTTCALPVAGGSPVQSGTCAWNTSQQYDFRYWTPGRNGEPAPVSIQIQTPAAGIEYPAASPPNAFFMSINLLVTGGPAVLPAVTGVGSVSTVAGLPVTFTLDVVVRAIPFTSDLADLHNPEWWRTASAGQCIWCTSYTGNGTAAGSSTFSFLPGTETSRAYALAGEETPEPAAVLLVLAGMAAMACARFRA